MDKRIMKLNNHIVRFYALFLIIYYFYGATAGYFN